MLIIYKATNNINGMVYVGLTAYTLKQRMSRHYCYGEFYFGCALRKYGRENFTFEVIDTAETREELGEKERYWIRVYNCKAPNGYNLTDGGECGYERSPETKKRMSEARKLFYTTEAGAEFKRLMSERGKIRVVLQETKDKISATLMGNKPWNVGLKGVVSWNEAQRQAQSLRLMGKNAGKKRPDFAEMLRNMPKQPGYVNAMKGKKRPDVAERNKSPEMRERTRRMGLANNGKGGFKKRTATTPADLPLIEAESRENARASLAVFLESERRGSLRIAGERKALRQAGSPTSPIHSWNGNPSNCSAYRNGCGSQCRRNR